MKNIDVGNLLSGCYVRRFAEIRAHRAFQLRWLAVLFSGLMLRAWKNSGSFQPYLIQAAMIRRHDGGQMLPFQ
jgi:hypothetical protein